MKLHVSVDLLSSLCECHDLTIKLIIEAKWESKTNDAGVKVLSLQVVSAIMDSKLAYFHQISHIINFLHQVMVYWYDHFTGLGYK